MFVRYQRKIAPPNQLFATQIEPQPPKSTSRAAAQGVETPNAIALARLLCSIRGRYNSTVLKCMCLSPSLSYRSVQGRKQFGARSLCKIERNHLMYSDRWYFNYNRIALLTVRNVMAAHEQSRLCDASSPFRSTNAHQLPGNGNHLA